MKKIITLLFLCSFLLANGQTNMDSVINVLQSKKTETEVIAFSNDITRKLQKKQELKEYKEYLTALDKYANKNKTLDSKTIKSLIYKYKGVLAKLHNKADSVFYYYSQGAKLVDKNHNLFADLNLNLGNYFLRLGKYNETKKHYELAAKTYKLNNNLKFTCLTLANLSSVQLLQNKLYEAEQNILKALGLNEQLQDNEISAYSYQNIGAIQTHIGNWEQAIKSFEKFLEFSKKDNNLLNVMNANELISQCYIKTKEFNKAKNYLDKSIAIIKTNQVQPNHNTLITHLAYSDLLIQQKQISLAEIYLEKAFQDLTITKYEQFRPNLIILKANILYEKGFYKQSMNTLKTTENQEFYNEVKLAILELKAKLFEKLKNFDKYVIANTEYKNFKEKKTDETVRLNSIYTQEKFQSKQKENEILKLSNDNIKKEAEAKTKNTQLNYALFGGGGILLLSLFILKAYRKEKKSKEHIELQKKEIETLHKEVHHRVKNNLAVAKSFISVAKENVNDKKGQEALNALQSRIDSMANVHETLYKQDNISAVNFQSYTERICDEISKTYNGKEHNISFSVDANIQIPINDAIPLGLILNEAVTNSFKHAFEGGEKGSIKIVILEDNNEIKCAISDDGIGMPKDFKIENSNSYGAELMQTLVMQLDGSIEMSNNNGTKIQITIPKN